MEYTLNTHKLSFLAIILSTDIQMSQQSKSKAVSKKPFMAVRGTIKGLPWRCTLESIYQTYRPGLGQG